MPVEAVCPICGNACNASVDGRGVCGHCGKLLSTRQEPELATILGYYSPLVDDAWRRRRLPTDRRLARRACAVLSIIEGAICIVYVALWMSNGGPADPLGCLSVLIGGVPGIAAIVYLYAALQIQRTGAYGLISAMVMTCVLLVASGLVVLMTLVPLLSGELGYFIPLAIEAVWFFLLVKTMRWLVDALKYDPPAFFVDNQGD